MPQNYYCSQEPYPPIQVECQNPEYAKAMLDNLGGSISEISAVTSYFYCKLVCDNYEEIAKAFHEISIVEMHHLDIYGRLVLQLGENPRLWTQKNKQKLYWTPEYIYYACNLKDLLKNARNKELDAIDKYRMQADKIKDEYIVAILERIILDEVVHVEVINQLITDYDY